MPIIGIFIGLIVASAFTGYDLFPGFTKPKSQKRISGNNNVTNVNFTSQLNETTIGNLTTKLLVIDEDRKNLILELNKTEQFIENMQCKKNDTVVPTELECQEEEPPTNIGAYEVPTEKDLIILYRETLVHRLNVYHKEILDFLRDIKDVTKASINYESRCGNRLLYRKCVRKISNQYIHAAKSQALTAEKKRHLNEPFIKGQVCKISDIKRNPMELLKTLAIEKTVLEFALPGFLRLLHECFRFCNKS